jgi:hypothetical protein
VTHLPRNTVPEVLECFENEFAEVASAFARGKYLLWLGSGISRDVVPGVPQLLQQMLDYLQTSIDSADPTCRFRKALEEILQVAGVPASTRASIDLATPVDTWLGLEEIVNRLIDRYSDVLDVQVQGESEDFLVWTGLDVPSTYGAADLEPDVEHLCVAILMLEGVVRSAPTTNWDGLVEAAMKRLAGDTDRVLRVIVMPADFAAPNRRAELVKFHGCAVRAADSPADYRSLLIARKSQISGWAAKPGNQMMKKYLEHLLASRPAFIVGLSAQDANIHIMLHEASQNLAKNWPTEPPAVVFAEHNLDHHHKHLMKVTYGDAYSANSEAIGVSALLGAYAKPALLGLVLFTVADKLSDLIVYITELAVPSADIERLQADVRGLRDAIGEFADADPRAFIDAVVSGLARALWVFRTGNVPDPRLLPYQPISTAPIPEAAGDPDFPCAALGRFALVAALLGRGLAEGVWTLEPGRSGSPSDGIVRVTTGHSTSRVFVVRDARVLSELELSGLVDTDDDEVVVVHTEAAQKPTTRSPRAHYGRSGRSGARQMDLESICTSVSTADELFEAFLLEGAL